MTCTWIGDGEGCTHPTVEGRSYCEEHLFKIYVRGSQLSKRKKDMKTSSTVHFWESLMNEAVEELEAEGFNFEEVRWPDSLVSSSDDVLY